MGTFSYVGFNSCNELPRTLYLIPNVDVRVILFMCFIYYKCPYTLHDNFLTWGLTCRAFRTNSTSWPLSFFSTTEKRRVSCDIFSRPHLKKEEKLNFTVNVKHFLLYV